MKSSRSKYKAVEGRRSWQPGFQRLPYLGIGALLLSVAGILISVAVLIASNEKPISSWRFQPTVYLSIASTLTNVCLSTALLEAVSIVWWNKSLKDGTVVIDLHRVWAFGTSFMASLTAGRHINAIAVACLMVAITPLNGPLLQRASHIGTQNTTTYPTIDIGISPQLSHNWPTGVISSRVSFIQVVTNNFQPVVQDFNNQKPINFSSACKSTCTTRVRGSGFRASCSDHTVPYNITPVPFNKPWPIFSSDFTFNVWESDPAVCSFTLLLKTSPGCLGTYTVRNCLLQVGLMEYSVSIDGPASTIALETGSTIWNDLIVGDTYNIPGEMYDVLNSTYGGIYRTLSNKFTDKLSMSYQGIGWGFDAALGVTGNAYIVIPNDFEYEENGCKVYMNDPTEDILQSARDLMFRSAIAASNSSTVQSVRVQQVTNETIYTSDYRFLGFATAVSFLGIMSVIWAFKDFWVLGRPVSMSPIEIAKAFNAVLLNSHDANATISELLDEVGNRPIKYGSVLEVKSSGQTPAELTPLNVVDEGEETNIPIIDDAPRHRLQFAEPFRVRKVQPHEKYDG